MDAAPDLFEMVFNRGEKKHGPRYRPRTPIDHQMMAIAQRIVAMHFSDPLVKPNVPSVEVGLIENLGFNASTTIEDGKAFVGIYYGTYMLLQHIFYRMLARPDVLTHIGDPTAEAKVESDLKDASPPRNLDELLQLTGEIQNVPKPVDPVRAAYARMLWEQACEFIVNHEIGHLLYGHVGLLQERTNVRIVDERPMGIEPRLLQTLEMDADTFAVAQATAYLNPAFFSVGHVLPSKQAPFIFAATFATYATERLFGFGTNGPGNRYPSPDMRRRILIYTFEKWINVWLSNVEGLDRPALIESIGRAVLECERAFVSMFGGNIPKLEILRSINDPWLADIVNGWREIAADLEPHCLRYRQYDPQS